LSLIKNAPGMIGVVVEVISDAFIALCNIPCNSLNAFETDQISSKFYEHLPDPEKFVYIAFF
jgi:hypothetical protein